MTITDTTHTEPTDSPGFAILSLVQLDCNRHFQGRARKKTAVPCGLGFEFGPRPSLVVAERHAMIPVSKVSEYQIE